MRERNNPKGEADALWSLCVLELGAGNWELADRYGADCVDLFTQLGTLIPPHEFPAALVAAHRGRVNEARARARAAVVRAESEGLRIAESGHRWVLGFIELSLGDPTAALAHLRRSYELPDAFRARAGKAPGGRRPARGVDRSRRARRGGGDSSRPGRSAPPGSTGPWRWRSSHGTAGCCSRHAETSRAAFASFERALAEHARSTDPFHHARTLLALGRTQRRAKKRSAARTTLEDALARFERLGAPLWADQTRTELTRIGGRTPSGTELTEGEQRIAALVAEGSTNREVAAALFLTVHSVETALTRIYRKLGVRSRAELAHLLAAKT